MADRWLRRGMAGIGAALVVVGVGGSTANFGTGPAGRPAASGVTASGATASGSASSGSGSATAPAPTPPTPPPPVLADDAGAGSQATPAGVAHALAGALADPRLGGQVGARVVDVASGRVLLDRGGDQPAVPASTAKLLTATAALAVLPLDDRLVTQVVAGAKPGEVVLVGGGDPTLSAVRAGAPTTYPGAARLTDLAAAVRRANPGRITRVVVDGSRFTGPRLAPGWDPSDVAGGYIAPITAVMTDGGRIDPAKEPRSNQPELAAGRALAALLGVPPTAVGTGTAPRGGRVLGTVRSAPLDQLIERMLLQSDNVLAEALARQVALAERLPADFAGAADAVHRVLGRIGIPVAAAHLLDGSGLSGQDRIPPAVLVAVLRTAVSTDHPTLHPLVPGLPVAGYDGTLDSRYGRGPTAAAAGSVRAKTGTLIGVSTLAGLAWDKDGRLLVFAFMADRVGGGALGAEAALDSAAAALAGCGCR